MPVFNTRKGFVGLVLKIAAGVIIAILVSQIISMKQLDYTVEKKRKHTNSSIGLNTQAIYLMNSVHRFYGEHKDMPKAVSDLMCVQYNQCKAVKHGGSFYVTYGGEWMAIDPYVVVSEVEFNCESTIIDRRDDRFDHCRKIDASAIPAVVK